MRRLMAWGIVLLVGTGVSARGEAAPASTSAAKPAISAKAKLEAAKLFKTGQSLYAAGRFAEAIVAFSKAQALSPHPFSLFNIARCHENLGRPQEALTFYRRALVATSDAKLAQDLRERIARLRRFPGKIFVTSDPAGASVTVDGAAAPQPKRTPFVMSLAAGAHVLLFRKAGHLLAARRVTLDAGREVTVRVVLARRRPKPKPCPPPPEVPKCLRCRDPRLIDFSGLHLHVVVNGGFAVAKDLGAVAGPGFQLTATIDRFRVGAHFQYLLVNPSSLAKLAGTDQRSSFMQGQIEGGYTFPMGRYHLYATVGVGLYLNRLISPGTKTSPDETEETGGVIWSLGGGIEVMAYSWLSLGIGLRVGLMHGDLLDVEEGTIPAGQTQPVVNTITISGPFPFGTLWGAVNFHL